MAGSDGRRLAAARHRWVQDDGHRGQAGVQGGAQQRRGRQLGVHGGRPRVAVGVGRPRVRRQRRRRCGTGRLVRGQLPARRRSRRQRKGREGHGRGESPAARSCPGLCWQAGSGRQLGRTGQVWRAEMAADRTIAGPMRAFWAPPPPPPPAAASQLWLELHGKLACTGGSGALRAVSSTNPSGAGQLAAACEWPGVMPWATGCRAAWTADAKRVGLEGLGGKLMHY